MSPATITEARKRLAEALRKRQIHAYEIADNYTVFAFTNETSFSLSFMPGNRRTVISHKVAVDIDHRGKGIGTQMCKLREEAAKEAGVTLMLATVMDSNSAEIRVLEKCGWKRLTQNVSTRCSLWGKQL